MQFSEIGDMSQIAAYNILKVKLQGFMAGVNIQIQLNLLIRYLERYLVTVS